MTVLATDELEAVNEILSAISESPVASLDEDTIDDAQIALNTLRSVSKQVQARGWHFNTDYDYPLTPDSFTGEIVFPLTAASVDGMDTSNTDIVKRGGKMYNRETRSFDFSDYGPVKCKIVWLLDFNDLPQLLKSYITLRASRKFASDVMGDEATYRYTKTDENAAWAEALADEARQADLNMLTGSMSVNRVVSRRRRY